MNKHCRECDKWLNLESFDKRRSKKELTTSNTQSMCRECTRNKQRDKYYDKDKHHNRKLKHQYGNTLEEYKKVVEEVD